MMISGVLVIVITNFVFPVLMSAGWHRFHTLSLHFIGQVSLQSCSVDVESKAHAETTKDDAFRRDAQR